MNFGIMEALNQITRERRVDKALLYETLEVGLTQAIKKKYGTLTPRTALWPAGRDAPFRENPWGAWAV